MGKKKYVPGRRTKLKIKVDNTKKVRLDPRARESWLGWWFGLSRWGTDASTSVSAEDLALTARDDILRWILLSLKCQPNQLSWDFPSRRTFFVLSTFIFSLVRRPGTYFFFAHYTVPGRRTKPKIKVDNTKKVRLDMGVRESWLGWRFRRNRWSTDMSKIEHVSLNSEDEILDRVNSETLNYSGLYSKNS